MKTITIIDFSHLFSRNIFVAISQTKPKTKKGKYVTEDYLPYFKHLLFNSLQHLKNKFGGEIVLALDSRNSWRKQLYSDYKGTRAKGKEKSEIIWEEVYSEIDNIVEAIRNNFPFKVLKIEYAEADDIGGVLSKKYSNSHNINLITSDKDWKQNLIYNSNVKMYDPIKLEHIDLDEWEKTIIETPIGKMSNFTALHTLLGDSGDNVPNVMFESEFSDNFKAYLAENEIKSTDVEEVKSLSIWSELVENYDTYKIMTRGKRKGQYKIDYRIYYRLKSGKLILKNDYTKNNLTEEYEIEEVYEKDIFRDISFGPVKAKKILDRNELYGFLNSKKVYAKNFVLSNKLVDFNKIPKEIEEDILDSYLNTEVKYSKSGIMNYFINEGLNNLVSLAPRFYSKQYQETSTSSLDDFF